jgi:inosose dehydratase
MKRRAFTNTIGLLPFLSIPDIKQTLKSRLPISSNEYNWRTFYQRENKDWLKYRFDNLVGYRKTGLIAIEPSLDKAEDVFLFDRAQEVYGIQVPSAYVNSLLHEKDQANKSIETVLAIAENLGNLETKILVTNPNPISWGAKIAKTDEQLKVQLDNLNKLGKYLHQKGIQLAYHTHDMEMLAGAKEFHHMLQNTDKNYVNFCFDLHWVYRGSGNSELAVFDVLKMYGARIIELHLRQSKNGVWQETFTAEGDIDYKKVAHQLLANNIKPLLVIEQCVEMNSPHTLDAVKAHEIDLKNVTDLFNN